MKCTSLVALTLLLAPPLFADAGQRIIPAGALISCTTGDGRINSKTTAVGDPILCKVNYRHGDFMMPYGSYVGGNFTEYKDPGHFVGKGWMQLDFDRLYVGGMELPIDAKVVDVPGYKIDAQGRILGKGHAVRDTVLWMIPVLWPIDLINLPRRGPRPTLKAETMMTLRLMEDIQVPVTPEPQRDPYGLMQRSPDAYAPEPQAPTQAPEAAPEDSYAAPAQPMYQPAPPPAMAYAPPVAVMPYYYAPAPVAYGGFVVGARPGYAAYGPRGYVRRPVYAPRAYGFYGVRAPMVRAGVGARPMAAARGGGGYGRR
jgi:hypothetical protein